MSLCVCVLIARVLSCSLHNHVEFRPLGAGKTTIVDSILRTRDNLRVVVAVNDFARVNVDERTLAHTQAHTHTDEQHTHAHGAGHACGSKKEHPGVVALSNGCVCCELLPSLRTALGDLLDTEKTEHAYDYAVIETSGVADPWSLVDALDARFGALYRARLDQVVVVVDTSILFDRDDGSGNENGTVEQAPHCDEALRSQIEAADFVVLNKCDLVCSGTFENMDCICTHAHLYYVGLRCTSCCGGEICA